MVGGFRYFMAAALQLRLTIAILLLFLIAGTGTITAVEPVATEDLSAVIAAARERGSRVVAFAQDTLANDWRFAQARELAQVFHQYPNIELIITNANGSTSLQVQHVEDLNALGVDLLIVSPRDAATMTPAVARAYRSGIPVVLLTRRIVGQEYTVFVGPDDEAIAADAAQYLVRKLNGTGRILVLQGVPSASTAIDRTQGFLSEIRRHPGIQIVDILPANYLRNDALLQMDAFLEYRSSAVGRVSGKDADPGFDALYAQSDSMAAGARLALEYAGYDLREIIIVGIDYIEEARQAIRDGKQNASFVYPTSSREAAQAALDILEGREVPRIIRVPSTMVTQENVELVEPIF